MRFFPFLLDGPPAGDPGQGGTPPAGSDDTGDPGQGGTPPADTKDKGTTDYEKSYKELRSDYDKKSGRLGRIEKIAEKFQYNPEEVEEFVDDLINELRMSHTKKTDEGGGGGDDNSGDEGNEGGGGRPEGGIPEKVLRQVQVGTTFSMDAKKEAEFAAFMRKRPDFDESMRDELDEEINRLIEERPQVLRKGQHEKRDHSKHNWYEIAMRAKITNSPDFLESIEKKAIEREDKRREALKGQELVTGGAPAGGKGKSLQDQLKEKFLPKKPAAG